MGLSQMSSAYFYGEGEPGFSRFPVVGLIKTSSSKEKITDSAAGATAFSTGKKSYNGAIAVDDNKNHLETLVEYFSQQGKSTGVIATSSVTHATPASFYAHVNSRNKPKKIASQIRDSPLDFFAGGGRDFFSKSLLKDLKEDSWAIDKEKLASASELQTGKKYGFLLADNGMPKMTEGRGDFLKRASELGINYLSRTEKGFFLMIEGSQIDWGGHANNSEYVISEVLDFEQTVAAALNYAEQDGNTLVIVTADHETGGFSLSSDKKKVPFQGMQSDYETIKPTFSTGGHSAAMVPVLAYGPGAEKFSGIYENTGIHKRILELAP
ncbi:MAG: alkaline phosphatase [Owenweeksia sp.]|nr:alkaline phosphatase [Owenweeksia sp.]